MEDPEAWHQTGDLHVAPGRGDPFAAAARSTRMPMVVTDLEKPDNPIVFANDAFVELTGYPREEILGRNCRFLQGPGTDPAKVAALREAIAARTDCHVELLNYRKDGTPFQNALYLSPVIGEDGQVRYFFASQLDVTDRYSSEVSALDARDRMEAEVLSRTAELQRTTDELRAALAAKTTLLHEVDHRVKNNLQMISSLIYVQSRAIADPVARASLLSMLDRIEAIATVHRRLYQSEDVSTFDVADFVRDMVPDTVAAAGREDVESALDLEPVTVPADKAAPLALIVGELVGNALRHAFPSDRVGSEPGVITVRIRRLQEAAGPALQLAVEDNGVGRAEPARGAEPASATPASGAARRGAPRGGFGTSLVEMLARQLRGRVEVESPPVGHRVVLTLPIGERSRPHAAARPAAEGASPQREPVA